MISITEEAVDKLKNISRKRNKNLNRKMEIERMIQIRCTDI